MLVPNRAMLIQNAKSAFKRQDLLAAHKLCQDLLKQNRNDGEALLLMHQIALRQNNQQEAISCCDRYIKLFPKEPAGYMTLGDFHLRSGRFPQAVWQFQRALKVKPNHTGALTLLARTYDMMGQSEKAQELLAPFIGNEKEDAAIAFSYGNLEIDAKRYQNAIEVLERHVRDTNMAPQFIRELWFVLGKAYERAGDADNAFAAYSTAHATAPFRYDFPSYLNRAEQIIQTFSAVNLAKVPRARHGSALPVFIVSRPRAGSTLVERILGAHPDVHNAGEIEQIPQLSGKLDMMIGSQRPYPQCILDLQQQQVDEVGREQIRLLQELNRKAKRVTIKELRSWVHLGLVEIMMPNACVIDLRRDPVDNCLACFSESLGMILPFQGDLKLLGLAHRLYERTMEHWRNTLNLRTLRVQYEEFVSDPERWTREIIEFVGLPWDNRCLDFHKSAPGSGTSTAAPTLSYQQVRQPIHKASIGRAAKFKKHLKPLLEGLGLPQDAMEA